MKQNLIMDIVQGMLPYLNNAQTQRLQEVLQHTLFDYEVAKTESDKGLSEQNLVQLFLSAKYNPRPQAKRKNWTVFVVYYQS